MLLKFTAAADEGVDRRVDGVSQLVVRHVLVGVFVSDKVLVEPGFDLVDLVVQEGDDGVGRSRERLGEDTLQLVGHLFAELRFRLRQLG